MTLCHCCSSIPANLFSFKRNEQCHHNHQPSFRALERSAQQGCGLCKLLAQAVKLYTGPYAKSSKWNVEDPIILCSTKFDGQEITSKWQQIGLIRSREIPPDWSDPCTLDKPGEHFRHLEVEAETIGQWATRCSNDHQLCSGQHKQDFMPTRLVSVGQEDALVVKLINSKDVTTTDNRYIALSHCWGSSMPESARTVKEKLEQYKQTIHLTDLTQTFRDIIDISRRLGIAYVWIDSLCIIQDSKEDWEAEAAQMASVYAGAYITIAASGSADGTGGCRVVDEERSFGPADLCITANPDSASERCDRRFRIWTRSPTPVSLKTDPLMQRGWTLQERELSSRMVHYSRDSIRWECHSLDASLEFPWHDRNAIGEERILLAIGDSSMHSIVSRQKSTDTGNPRMEKRGIDRASWKNLVKRYTQRSLTYQSDVLPALSGMARALVKATADEYVAGLWKSCFLECLLWASDWHCSRGINQHTRPVQYLAPSWSWASIKGRIDYPSWVLGDRSQIPEQDPFYSPRLLEIDCQPASVDSFSTLKGGNLRLEGKLKVAFAKYEQYSMSGHQDRLDLCSPVRLDDGTVTSKKVGQLRFDIPLCEHCAPAGSVAPVFVLACLHSQTFDDGQFHVFGIALEHASNFDTQDNTQTFQRVGLVWGMRAEFWTQAPVITTQVTIV